MRSLLAILVAGLLLPASALAQAPTSGGTSPDDALLGADRGTSVDGGTRFGDELPGGKAKEKTRRAPAKRKRPARRKSSRAKGRPYLSAFDVRPGSFFIYGRSARIDFTVQDRSRSVRVKVSLLPAGGGRPVRVFDLGDRPTGTRQTFRISGREQGLLPQGSYELRLSARDPGGRVLSRSASKSGIETIGFHWHRFPLAGPFTYGGEDARFGAGRPGHSHQGQDLVAAEGTPVPAPRAGVVTNVAYQAGGAGHYVILDGLGEDRDYAFMHLKTGSIAVRQGDRVRTGQLLGAVGSTGASSGPHLHFEVWEGGGWYSGGKPTDPLPYLKRWDAWS